MTEKITVNVPHKLGKAAAKSRIDGGFAKVQEQIAGKSVDIVQSWQGDDMNFSAGIMGQTIAGKLTVMEDKVLIEVNLPWLMAKLAGTVKDKLAKGTQLLLDKR